MARNDDIDEDDKSAIEQAKFAKKVAEGKYKPPQTPKK